MNGKPENPLAFETADDQPYAGMTLRDYFAGQALLNHPINQHDHDAVAQHCLKQADAMLKARQA